MRDDQTMAFELMFRALHPEAQEKVGKNIHLLYDKQLLQEMLDYTPPREKPYGEDWDYELDKLRIELHRKIEKLFEQDRYVTIMLDMWKETGVMICSQPPHHYVTGFDPIA